MRDSVVVQVKKLCVSGLGILRVRQFVIASQELMTTSHHQGTTVGKQNVMRHHFRAAYAVAAMIIYLMDGIISKHAGGEVDIGFVG